MTAFVTAGRVLAGAALLLAIGRSDAGSLAMRPAPASHESPVYPDELVVAQESMRVAVSPTDTMRVPFGVGERLEYEVKYKWFKVGNSVLELRNIEDVRGRAMYHASMVTRGRVVVFSVHNTVESWFDLSTLSSHRFFQDLNQTSYKKKRTIEIFPERLMFREDQKPEQPSVPLPLDDASFFYFIRTIPLDIGKTYEFPRYYNPASNPVRVMVVRRDTVETPAGTFPAIVLHPTFKSGGLFGEGGKAEVWIADDSTRIMLQMKVSLKIGSLQLSLRNYKAGTPIR